jgi:aldose sugar dehydrogenase
MNSLALASARLAFGTMVLSLWSSAYAASDDLNLASDGGSRFTVTTLQRGLQGPWGLSFLLDGRMLVTEKSGRLLLLKANGTFEHLITGVPVVAEIGQGGLMDVQSAQEGTDTWVYLSYTEAGREAESGMAGTAVGRGKLRGTALTDWQIVYRQLPKVMGGLHFGSRLALKPDGTLFITLGDRGQDSMTQPSKEFAQHLGKSLGKVIRLRVDGGAARDMPSWPAGSAAHLYSYGHRNPQGAALHPDTGELWVVEHGPQGGDELNRVVPGGNYGWPLRSYGCPYGAPVGTACRIGGGTHAPDFIEPVATWVPTSTAPAGLMFYSGDKFPDWRGQAFIAALAGRSLWRVQLNAGREVARVRMLASLGERIRDVKQGPEGFIYLLTDSGKLLKIEREKP